MRTSKPYKLVIPLAGKGSRMTAGGFKLPKPMLVCGDKSILEWGMQSIDYSECEVEFVCRGEHIREFGIFEWLQDKFGKDIGVTQLDFDTKGAIETVLAGINQDDDNPLIVMCPDITFEPIFKPKPEHFKKGGYTLAFKSNSTNYSYIDTDSYNVTSVWEKVVSRRNLANVGVYCFQSCKLFAQHAVSYLSEEIKSQYNPTGEAHIAPLYNHIIDSGNEVGFSQIEKVHIMGTPEEFAFFESVSFKYLAKPRAFALCADHSGFELKHTVKDILNDKKIPYIDFGCHSSKDCDYNTYVDEVCKYILKTHNYLGLGICRSGQGINICANKHSGIRSALIQDEWHARHAINHNAANFFALSAIDFQSADESLEEVLWYLNSETFDGGRHQTRLMKNNG